MKIRARCCSCRVVSFMGAAWWLSLEGDGRCRERRATTVIDQQSRRSTSSTCYALLSSIWLHACKILCTLVVVTYSLRSCSTHSFTHSLPLTAHARSASTRHGSTVQRRSPRGQYDLSRTRSVIMGVCEIRPWPTVLDEEAAVFGTGMDVLQGGRTWCEVGSIPLTAIPS